MRSYQTKMQHITIKILIDVESPVVLKSPTPSVKRRKVVTPKSTKPAIIGQYGLMARSENKENLINGTTEQRHRKSSRTGATPQRILCPIVYN